MTCSPARTPRITGMSRKRCFWRSRRTTFYIKKTQKQWYSPRQEKFLPDRYVEGTCYICGYTNARSDQCDKCGNLLEPELLLEPRSKIDGSTPELRETEHYFLDLSRLQNQVVEFLKVRESFWRPNVMRQSLGQIGADSLHGRSITRDLDWGIPLPKEILAEGKEWESKRLYVWVRGSHRLPLGDHRICPGKRSTRGLA